MAPQLAVIDEVLDRYPQDPASLIMVLQDVQAALNHVPDEAVDRLITAGGQILRNNLEYQRLLSAGNVTVTDR